MVASVTIWCRPQRRQVRCSGGIRELESVTTRLGICQTPQQTAETTKSHQRKPTLAIDGCLLLNILLVAAMFIMLLHIIV